MRRMLLWFTLSGLLGLCYFVLACSTGGNGSPQQQQEVYLVVVNFAGKSVTVYKATDNGDTAPLRTIIGANTSITEPFGVAVHPSTKDIYLGDYTDLDVSVFNFMDDGNVAPKRQFSSVDFNGTSRLAFNESASEIFVANEGYGIVVMDASASGTHAALRKISGASTNLSSTDGMALDIARSEFFVTSGGNSSVHVFNLNDDGDVAPKRTISGASTGFDYPIDVAIDQEQDEIIVFDVEASSIFFFNRTDTGNVAPKRTISGGLTGIETSNGGMAVDFDLGEIFIAQLSKVLVFNLTDNGDVAPKRTIEGDGTGLSVAVSVALAQK